MNQSYKLVWSDEFDYTGTPDLTKWNFDVGGSGFGNNEDQYYTNSNSSNAIVQDGKLIITARKEQVGNRMYSSAKLMTYQRESWCYGKFEIRAKMPKGKGMWPAIWMLPDTINEGQEKWPRCGEIDIMENVGKVPDVVHFSLHSEHHNHIQNTQFTSVIKVPELSEKFFTYGLVWTEDKIEFYLDDELQYSVLKEDHAKGWPFNKPFYLILNLAVGGNWGGAIDDSIFPQTLEVEYVRVYQ
ncbi:MAG: glycoside hydrolase family 16 protein [Turicibacter sp.]